MSSDFIVGADVIPRARRLYSAFLPALAYEPEEGPEGLSLSLPERPGQPIVAPEFYVKPPSDGRPAPAGNGAMIAFQAQEIGAALGQDRLADVNPFVDRELLELAALDRGSPDLAEAEPA